jgi:hypothetical protein
MPRASLFLLPDGSLPQSRQNPSRSNRRAHRSSSRQIKKRNGCSNENHSPHLSQPEAKKVFAHLEKEQSIREREAAPTCEARNFALNSSRIPANIRPLL